MVNGNVDANRLGIVGAIMLTVWHGVWLTLVATGSAQRVADFVLRLHAMKSDVVVEPFQAGPAALLLLTTAVLGYVGGAAAALLWNGLGAVCVRSKAGAASRM